MNLASRITLLPLAGLVAAFLTLLVTDVFRILPIADMAANLTPQQARQHVLATVFFGTTLCTLLAAAQHALSGRRQFYRLLPLTITVGAISALIGVTFGMSVMAPLYTTTVRNPGHFLGNVLARGLAWMLIGGFVGLADGFRTRSVQTGRNGAIGGIIGGFLGGLLFECVPYLIPNLRVGAVSRMIGFATTGGTIGLFVALVQQFLQEAWLRHDLGRNEGRDYLIDQETMFIGRSELDGIPIYGDASIAKGHAFLQKINNRWAVTDTGKSQSGTRVNGVQIAQAQPLQSGDQIQIGGATLTFIMRNVTAWTERTKAESARPAAMATSHTAVQNTGTMHSAPKRLMITAGPAAGTVLPILHEITLGRDPVSVNTPIPADDKLSRKHARISVTGGSVVLEDCGSTNGTFVNGQRITQQELVIGDTIHIGATVLQAVL